MLNWGWETFTYNLVGCSSFLSNIFFIFNKKYVKEASCWILLSMLVSLKLPASFLLSSVLPVPRPFIHLGQVTEACTGCPDRFVSKEKRWSLLCPRVSVKDSYKRMSSTLRILRSIWGKRKKWYTKGKLRLKTKWRFRIYIEVGQRLTVQHC